MYSFVLHPTTQNIWLPLLLISNYVRDCTSPSLQISPKSSAIHAYPTIIDAHRCSTVAIATHREFGLIDVAAPQVMEFPNPSRRDPTGRR
uniref:Uncharacterized protein n=1 Tax=Oryza sativa subsp. japonica TaxID=39947 RepID=Q6K2W7_ORYSJ|nr:hypothetical protein [Oryza sativa Japonica Group]